MTLPKVKPCPFCGSEDRVNVEMSISGYEFWAFCDGCQAIGPTLCDIEGAVEAWNKAQRSEIPQQKIAKNNH